MQHYFLITKVALNFLYTNEQQADSFFLMQCNSKHGECVCTHFFHELLIITPDQHACQREIGSMMSAFFLNVETKQTKAERHTERDAILYRQMEVCVKPKG